MLRANASAWYMDLSTYERLREAAEDNADLRAYRAAKPRVSGEIGRGASCDAEGLQRQAGAGNADDEERGVMSERGMRGLLVRVGVVRPAVHGMPRWTCPRANLCTCPIPESRPLPPWDGVQNYDKLVPPPGARGYNATGDLEGKSSHLIRILSFSPTETKAPAQGGYGRCLGKAQVSSPFTPRPEGRKNQRELMNALIGLYHVAKVLEVKAFPRSRWHQNAHTRRTRSNGDVVVLAEKGRSGRFARCIVIGRYRDRAHRVDRPVLNAWGGLAVRDGYIQRSARLPEFVKPARFLGWLEAQNPQLIAANNPD